MTPAMRELLEKLARSRCWNLEGALPCDNCLDTAEEDLRAILPDVLTPSEAAREALWSAMLARSSSPDCKQAMTQATFRARLTELLGTDDG